MALDRFQTAFRRALLPSLGLIACTSIGDTSFAGQKLGEHEKKTGIPLGAEIKAVGFRITEEPLGTLEVGRIDGSFLTSADRKHAAYALKRGKKTVVVLDGVPGQEYDQIAATTELKETATRDSRLVLSPDGKRVAYLARRAGRSYTVVDGVGAMESPPYDNVAYPIFSPDSRDLHYAAFRDKKWCYVIHGVEEGGYDAVTQAVTGANGRRMAYGARRNGMWLVVMDGVESKPYAGSVSLPFLQFSRDGRHLFCIRKSANTQAVVLDGIEKGSYEQVEFFLFSTNGQRVAYTAVRDGHPCVVVDGVEGKPYAVINDLEFSPDSRRVAYTGWRDGKKMVVIDRLEGKQYDDVASVKFSLDSRHAAYSGQRSGVWFAIVDGVETEMRVARYPQEVYFSPNGRRTVTEVDRSNPKDDPPAGEYSGSGKHVLIEDGRESKIYQGIRTIRFSPNSQRLVYVATLNGKEWVVEDGVKGKAYDRIYGSNMWPLGYVDSITFSPDSRHLVYGAERQHQYFIIVDGAESRPYDDLLSEPVFDSSTTFHLLAKREGKLFRVQIALHSQNRTAR